MKSLLFASLLCCGIASAGEYRTFTDPQGRKIEARLIKYDSVQEKVQMERKDGIKLWVSTLVLSKNDQKYIEEWQLEKQFLDQRVLAITVEEESSGWTVEDGDNSGRKEKSSYYQVSLINNGPHAFDNMRVDYCIYRACPV